MNDTWEQKKAIKEQEETDSYKMLMGVFQKVQKVSPNWQLVPSLIEPLRKFHGATEINGVKIKLGLRKTRHKYDFQSGMRPESRWIALSVPVLMEKYRWNRNEVKKWSTHQRWTASTVGVVKKILSKASSLAALAKIEVDAESARIKHQEEYQKKMDEFQRKAEEALPLLAKSPSLVTQNDAVNYKVIGMTLNQAMQLQELVKSWDTKETQ